MNKLLLSLFFAFCLKLSTAQTPLYKTTSEYEFVTSDKCKHLTSNEEKRKCFRKELDKHVEKNFIYPNKAIELDIEGKVFVTFRIDKKGNVEILSVKSPHEILETAARKIFEKLPKFIQLPKTDNPLILR